MRDILKELNDRNPSDVQDLDERGLRRFEVLCEAWAKIADGGTCATPSVAEAVVPTELATLML